MDCRGTSGALEAAAPGLKQDVGDDKGGDRGDDAGSARDAHRHGANRRIGQAVLFEPAQKTVPCTMEQQQAHRQTKETHRQQQLREGRGLRKIRSEVRLQSGEQKYDTDQCTEQTDAPCKDGEKRPDG